MKLTDEHTITAVVVTYTAGNGRPTLGQCPLDELPKYLRDAVDRFNADTLKNTLTIEEK